MISDLTSCQFERILLIKPSALGDVVHTLPVLVKLHTRYPDARIDWLITPENADLVCHHPDLSNTILFPRKALSHFGRDWSATVSPFRLLSTIRRNRYDLVIDLHGQFRSALFTLASGAPVRIGYDRPRVRIKAEGARRPRGVFSQQHGWTGAREGSWIAYTHRMPIPTLDVHAVDRYLWLAPLLGLDDRPPDFTIHLAPQATRTIEKLLRSHGLGGKSLAVLVPGTIWETKHWSVAGFAQVGRHLLESGYEVVVAGTKRDRPRSQAIVAACPGACDLCGQTSVAELVALIQRAAICVTNDSGSMHVAVAVGSPVVSVFGPTNPVWIGPYGRPHAVVRVDIPCSPCYLRKLRNCPNNHICMRELTPAMVIDRVERVIARSLVGATDCLAR
ncbi:MAG: glycosyltransferase family 9 protein [Planctomycetaceae bacterium]|nr:glycosyltransferase family 9 protein [Planctomycetaceae bacterium]